MPIVILMPCAPGSRSCSGTLLRCVALPCVMGLQDQYALNEQAEALSRKLSVIAENAP
jgi:hypothetical protein